MATRSVYINCSWNLGTSGSLASSNNFRSANTIETKRIPSMMSYNCGNATRIPHEDEEGKGMSTPMALQNPEKKIRNPKKNIRQIRTWQNIVRIKNP